MDRRWFLGAGCAVAGSLVGPAAWAAASPRVVALQPLGPVPPADLALIERALGAFFELEVRRLPAIALPRSAYYRPRARHRAEKLLDFLAARRPEGVDRVLGVTARDVSTSKPPHADWGILGLATLGGASCVVSSFRCRRGARSAAHARSRLGKVAVHELAHTFGLDHCTTAGCLLADGGGTVRTVDGEHDLCPETRRGLEREGVALRDREPPWPRQQGPA
ncbi:MAG: hypothetical protein IT376_05355 [Polyangiaceae bacterium]|nr:hypothetical protein [Polyangiaceae bacterium]